jgi:RNA polymerase sigma-70 factor (ECF subfamily)
VAEPQDPGDELGNLETWDAANRVMQCALSLPVAYREPLLLRCVRSMTYQQIGDVLGLPVTTVETRLARARRMLREEMADAGLVEDQAPGSANRKRPE